MLNYGINTLVKNIRLSSTVFYFLLLLPLLAEYNLQNIIEEKNIRKAYLDIKSLQSKNVILPSEIYYELARRSYLSLNLPEALWASDYVLLQPSLPLSLSADLYYLKGNILKDSHRYEEAIVAFKKVIFNQSYSSINKVTHVQEKCLLSLIDTYILKKNNKSNRDIEYLKSIFKEMFPNSKYLMNIQIGRK